MVVQNSNSYSPWQLDATDEEPMSQQPAIFVVDDDPGVGRALMSVGQLLDLEVLSYPNATDFLAGYDPSRPGCVVLDMKMPGMTGLELLREFSDADYAPPVVMISGHADVPLAVEAMSRGALTLLEKPFRLDDLTKHIRQAIALDRENREKRDIEVKTESQLALLTTKEREVLDLIVGGKTNRQIASALHISQRAVEDRRSRLMRKLQVRSIVDLLQQYCTKL